MARGKGKGKDRHGPGRLEDQDGGSGEAWLATYADAITLLMAFFMILYAMSQVDQVKFEALIAGFAEPFGNDSTGRNAGQVSLLDSGAGVVEFSSTDSSSNSDATPNSPTTPQDPFAAMLSGDPMAREPETGGAGATGVAEPAAPPQTDPDTGLPLLDVSDLREVQQQIEDALVLQEELENVDFEITGNQLVIAIEADEVLFTSGSAVLQPRGSEVLAALAPVINEFANVVEVVGHTDDRPLNRGGYTNWDLSGDRALAVLDQLADRFGIDPRRLGYRGYADQRPLVPNDSDANRARNRRVELVIIANET